jgi:hypothetical protein
MVSIAVDRMGIMKWNRLIQQCTIPSNVKKHDDAALFFRDWKWVLQRC